MSETVPEALTDCARARPRGPALRAKRRGIWQETSWQDYDRRVGALAAALAGVGLLPGRSVLIQGGNTAARQTAELAVLAAGGVAVCADEGAHPSEIASLCRAAPPWAVIADTPEAVGALREAARAVGVPDLRAWALRGGTDSAPAFSELERSSTGAAPPAVTVRSADPALVLLTSGADGSPRPVTLSHGALLAAAEGFAAAAELSTNEVFFSFMPTGWIGDRTLATALHPLTGATLAFPEDARSAMTDMQEAGPTLLIAPPRFWRRLALDLRLRAGNRGLRARLVQTALGAEYPSALARFFVARPARDSAGLLRLRHAFCAGAAADLRTRRFFRALGAPLHDLYLLTDAGGPVALGAVDDDGGNMRLLAGFAAAMDGAELTITPPGGAAIATGDAGAVGGDTLALGGRLRAREQLSSGQDVDTDAVVRALDASSFIRHAVIAAHGRLQVAALIDIDDRAVGAWSEANHTGLAGRAEFVRAPAVHALIEQAVAEANATLPPAAAVQAFSLLAAPLDTDAQELTRLHTVRQSAALASRAEALAELDGGDRATFGRKPGAEMVRTG